MTVSLSPRNQFQGQSQSPKYTTLGASGLPAFLRIDMLHDLISIHNGMHIPETGQPSWQCAVACTPKSTGSNRKFSSSIPTFFLCGDTAQNGPRPSRFEVSRSHTIRHTHPVGPLWTRDQLVAKASTYTTQNKHKRRTAMPSSEFEPLIPTIKWPQTYALDRTATEIARYPPHIAFWRPIFISVTPSSETGHCVYSNGNLPTFWSNLLHPSSRYKTQATGY